jgi:hypothetical protein
VQDGISGCSRVAVLMDGDMLRTDTENQDLMFELDEIEAKLTSEVNSELPKLERLLRQLRCLEISSEALSMVQRELDVAKRVSVAFLFLFL